MTDTGGFGGPDADLLARFHVAMQLPPAEGESLEEQQAQADRLLAASTYADLAPADREWLDNAVVAVTGGAAWRTWANPESWGGDWAAQDAALDAGEPPPIDGVLAGGDVPVDEVSLSPAELAELASYDEAAAVEAKSYDDAPLGADDDGWVG